MIIIDFTKIRTLIDRVYTINNMPISLLDGCNNTVYCRPNQESYVLPDILVEMILKEYFTKKTQNNYFIYNCFMDCYIGLIKLEQYKLLIGPISAQVIDYEMLSKNYGRMMSHSEVIHLSLICMQSLPISLVQLANEISIIYEVIFQKYIEVNDMVMDVEIKENLYIPEKLQESNKNQDYIEQIILFEANLYRAIVSGEKDRIEEFQSVSMQLIANLFSKSDKKMEYIVIPLLTIVTRAAIRGGADAKLVFEYYDFYMEKVKEVTSTAQFLAIFTMIIYKNAEFVKMNKCKIQRPLICYECEKYILDHIYQSIKVFDIAESCGYSERQIQRIFQKYYQMTVTQYINKEKFERATALLYATNYSISDISRKLGFISQSYFTKKFREIYGCTPTEFITKYPSMAT